MFQKLRLRLKMGLSKQDSKEINANKLNRFMAEFLRHTEVSIFGSGYHAAPSGTLNITCYKAPTFEPLFTVLGIYIAYFINN